jgi:hypothetical protein
MKQIAKKTPMSVEQMKAEMRRLFERACASLGIAPKSVYIGAKSHACFSTESAANELVEALRLAGQTADVFRWGPDVDPDWSEDEWQVSW